MSKCPVCGHANPPAARTCTACGERLAPTAANRPEDPFGDDGEFDEEGDSTGGVIPYKNPPALIAYYLGLFSGFPLIGLPLGIAAFVLGIIGLKKRRENPKVKGSAHAWIGIGCGGLFTVIWTLAAVGIVFAILNDR